MPEIILRFAKLSENATAPSKGSKYAAGYDLYSAYDYEVPAAGKVIVKTDIQIQLPEGCYGRVAPRSGLAANHHIDIGAGVIDQDYRGNVGVVMFNHSQTVFKVNKGDRVAQLICECILYPEIQEAKIPLKEVMEDSAQPVRTDTLYSAERNLSVKQRLAGLELLPVYNHVLVDTLVRCLKRNP